MTTKIAPYQINLGPNATVDSGTVDLTVYCGSDWSLSVPFTASDGVTAVNVSNPQMVIKETQDHFTRVLVTPTLSATTNTVTISIPGSASKAVTAGSGYYDLFVTRADTGGTQKLCYGQVTFIPETTST